VFHLQSGFDLQPLSVEKLVQITGGGQVWTVVMMFVQLAWMGLSGRQIFITSS
jgi:hypothetical protein